MRRTLAAAALVLLVLAGQAAAEEYPQRPVKLIVPFPAGGVADTVSRIVAQKLTALWGQQAVVDNRTGAAGLLGVELAAHAPNDGYTLLCSTSDFATVNPAAYSKLNYDPDKDFVPIAMIAKSPSVIVVNAKAGIDTLQDLAKVAKAKPGEIAYSSPGAGTTNHLAGELLASGLNIKLLAVQYRGGAPAATAVASGEATLGVVAIPTGKAYVQAGAVKVLGITTADRASFVPDWPTIAERGLPGFDLALWIVLYGPAGTPQPMVQKLQGEVAQILKDPEVGARFATLGAEPAAMSFDAFVARVKSDRQTLGEVIKKAGIRIE